MKRRKTDACNTKKINKYNYRFYLPMRIQCFKSGEQDFLPSSFSLVLHLVSRVETNITAPLDMMSPMFLVWLA